MNGVTKNEEFHKRLELLVGTEEPFRWAKRMEIPAATFARIWNNYDIPKHEHLCRIAQKCNVSLDWLLMGENNENSSTASFSFLPLIGLANCGIAQGWFNETELLNQILLPSFMSEEKAFAVLCRGRSMVPAGIEDGNVCIVYPNRAVESGKPALIRTKGFVSGREVSLATVKMFDSQDETSVFLSGWLEPDENGTQSRFTEKRLKSCITQIAPVGKVLSVKMPEESLKTTPEINEKILEECLETLHPLYEEMNSRKFSKLILLLYEKIKENGSPDMQTIRSLTEIISSKSNIL